jgi:hypothetical protein
MLDTDPCRQNFAENKILLTIYRENCKLDPNYVLSSKPTAFGASDTGGGQVLSKTRALLLCLSTLILGAALVLGLGKMGLTSVPSKEQMRASSGETVKPRQSAQRFNNSAERPRPVLSAPLPTTTPPEPDNAKALDEDEDEAHARADAAFKRMLWDFERAPEDSDWAPSAASALRENLGTLSSALGYDVESLECKYKRCVARVRWESIETALREHNRIPQMRYARNCAVEIRGNTEDATSSGILTHVVFSNCK